MARRDGIDIRFEGLDRQADLMGDMYKDWVKITKQEMTKFGLLVEEGAKALAPHDEGDLEDSISADPAKQSGDAITVEIGASAEHALIRHEAPYKKGSRDKYDNGAKFPHYYVDGRGQRTRTKSSWRGFQPGRKYLQNAVTAVEPDYDKMNQRIQERVINGKRGTQS